MRVRQIETSWHPLIKQPTCLKESQFGFFGPGGRERILRSKHHLPPRWVFKKALLLVEEIQPDPSPRGMEMVLTFFCCTAVGLQVWGAASCLMKAEQWSSVVAVAGFTVLIHRKVFPVGLWRLVLAFSQFCCIHIYIHIPYIHTLLIDDYIHYAIHWLMYLKMSEYDGTTVPFIDVWIYEMAPPHHYQIWKLQHHLL